MNQEVSGHTGHGGITEGSEFILNGSLIFAVSVTSTDPIAVEIFHFGPKRVDQQTSLHFNARGSGGLLTPLCPLRLCPAGSFRSPSRSVSPPSPSSSNCGAELGQKVGGTILKMPSGHYPTTKRVRARWWVYKKLEISAPGQVYVKLLHQQLCLPPRMHCGGDSNLIHSRYNCLRSSEPVLFPFGGESKMHVPNAVT